MPSHVENFYVYGAVEPSTGDSLFLELPYLDPTNFQIFLKELAHHYQDPLNLVIMDNGSCHKAKSLSLPRHIVCLFLPPYRPELNPIERLWREMKDQLAWVLAAQLEELEHRVASIIRRYTRNTASSPHSFSLFRPCS